MKKHLQNIFVISAVSLSLLGCGSSQQTASIVSPGTTSTPPSATDTALRSTLATNEVTSIVPPQVDPKLRELGQLLFFDPILSGNKDVSCSTCHHPTLVSGDSRVLPVGVGGGTVLGPDRQLGPHQDDPSNPLPFVPRNSPEIFNRGQAEWSTMFWDSRLTGHPSIGFFSPAGSQLPEGSNFLNPLAVQAMFPVTSRDEMRGMAGDQDLFGQPNEIAAVPDDNFTQMWTVLIERLKNIPEYVALFQQAYPEVATSDLHFSHAANAIASFEEDAFTGVNSPFDRYLRGDNSALTDAQKRGAMLFYGDAKCSQCHSGKLLTDQRVHNICAPQIGPGKESDGSDRGHILIDNQPEYAYAFRTPPLRNVAITGPYFHSGAYMTLEGAVRHHLNPPDALQNYDVSQLPTEFQGAVRDIAAEEAAMIANLDPILATPIHLTDDEVADVVAFLESLTDPAFHNMQHLIPDRVPSGLPPTR